ncbi:hypothetical protein TsFJ059_001965 [Trichoderma semiorbis]|uniref:Zn(2)-C6 fungal-type domain-containing protein n=1 Tax=Trichoderma semiorbis TaxID=1491008 RepID=A0A9P8I0L9_9HYPO|nr:hypothetical protein TsFJ059_001965 [Trichoderma semiorbis]
MSTGVARRQPRSKGCEQCISRRIKCDERAGCCKKCARFGLPCSGAIRGAVFLDMTEKVACKSLWPRKKKKRRVADTKETAKEQVEKPAPTDDATKRQGSTEESEGTDDATKQRGSTEESDEITPIAASSASCNRTTGIEEEISYLDLLTNNDESETIFGGATYQPIHEHTSHFDEDNCFGKGFDYNINIPPELDASAYNEYCFVGNFAQLIISSRRNYSSQRPQSWILELPHLAATNALPSSLRYAMHAAALLYHAVTNNDIRAKIAAVRWYIAGIQTYRATILKSPAKKTLPAPVPEAAQGSKEPCIAEIAEICVPIMFSFYEALQGGGSNAELLHHAAATEMLEKRGPEQCVSGLAHSVMRSLRVREAFYSIMNNRAAKFSSPEWLSIPFEQKHKICYDRLIDILLSLTKVLRLPYMNQRGATLRYSVNRVHDLSTARKADMEERVNTLLAQLQDWWLDFQQEHCEIITLSPQCSYTPENAYITVSSPSSVLPLSGPWMVANNETLTSSMISIYSATHMILHTILFIISLSRPPPNPNGPDNLSDVDVHLAAISAYATAVFNASAYLSMINPFCGDAVRTNFSLAIVAQFALEDSQRDQARRMLNQWHVDDEGSPNSPGTTKSESLVL